MNKISSLQVEYKTTPLGMDEPCPRFFYRLEGGRIMQKKYRIKVRNAAGETMWDSGITENSDTVQLPYAGKPFAPFTPAAFSFAESLG